MFRISVQLSVERLIAHVVCNSQHAPVYFYLITGRIQLNCFDRSDTQFTLGAQAPQFLNEIIKKIDNSSLKLNLKFKFRIAS